MVSRVMHQGRHVIEKDNGEEVSSKIEIIVFDYTITSVLEPQDESEE
jgi:hypothetical protein